MRYALGLNNKALSFGNKPLGIDESLPILPDKSLRLLYKEGVTPTFSKGTAVQISQNPNIWDLTYDPYDNSWLMLLSLHTDLLSVLEAKTTGITVMTNMFHSCSSLNYVCMLDTSNVTNMAGMFFWCSSLTSIPLFDTLNVTNISTMFAGCSSLVTVPLFDTSNVTNMERTFSQCSSLTSIPLFNTKSCVNMNSMFTLCYKVESGALALYNQASSQAIPPETHTETFYKCGKDTITGAAELAQIPTSWGGTLE